MSVFTRGIAVSAAVALLGLPVTGLTGSAVAAPDEPCAKEAAQLEKAQAAFDRVQAVYAKQKQKVKDAKDEVAEADSKAEKKAAKKDLDEAKVKKAEVKENKRGQKMRLAKKQAAYDDCIAGETPEEETPSEM
jgi:hypothetical protein